MTSNIITLENKLAARKKIKRALIDELIADYKEHDRLVIVCTSLKISLDAEKKQLDGLAKQIEFREEKLIDMCVGAEAANLKKVLRG